MLRLIVLLLVLLNGVYFAWGQGWLLPYGWGPTTQREPQRLAQQVRPEALTLQTAGTVAQTAPTAPPAPVTVCLQSAELEAAQATALRSVLQAALPADAWSMQPLGAASRWLLYMGKYANAADLAKKRAQLAGLGLKIYPLGNPELAPGLSLGSYATQAQADEALEALKPRGIRTARVLEDAPALAAWQLRLQGVPDSLQKPLAELQAQLPDKPLVACPVPEPVPQ